MLAVIKAAGLDEKNGWELEWHVRTTAAAWAPVPTASLAYCEYVAPTPGIGNVSRTAELVRSGGTSSGGTLRLDL